MRRLVLALPMIVGIAGVLGSACRPAERMGAFDPAHRILGSPAGQMAQGNAALDRSAGLSLTPALTGSLQPTMTEHFEVFHEPGASYTDLAGRTLESAYRHFYQVFSQAGFDLRPPQGRLVWICFPRKSSFNQYALQVEGMDLSWLDGYYSTLTNRVAIVQTDSPGRQQDDSVSVNTNLGAVPVAVAANRSPQQSVPNSSAGQRFDVTRLTHEAAHQLAFNSGIQTRGVMYPLWVSEGLATNFEFSGGVAPGLEHINLPRRNGLLEAYTAGELVPLRQFVVQTTVPPDVNVGRRYYAQAWGFFQFVLTERPEGLRTYLHRLAQLPLDRRGGSALLAEFTGAFGPPETLENAWNAFLSHQAQQTLLAR